MKQLFLKASVLIFCSLPFHATGFAQQGDKGYQDLFNGKDTTGWRSAKGAAFPTSGWEVKGGELIIHGTGGKESAGAGDIISNKEYRAFDLIFEFKLTPGANSGVKYFVTLEEKTAGSNIGLEYQVLDDSLHPDAKLGKNGNRTLASLYDLIPAKKTAASLRPIGQWNKGRIIVYPNNHVEHYLNGVKVVEYERGSGAFKALVAGSKYAKWPDFGEAKQGHILLQEHGNEVHYRNIKIRELQ